MRDTSLDEFIGGDGDDSDGDDGSEDDAAETVGPVPGDGESGTDRDDVGEERTDRDDVAQEPAAGDGLDEGGAASDGARPAVSTSEWTPDGATCAECDAVVERRWRDGGELVCPDCKDW